VYRHSSNSKAQRDWQKPHHTRLATGTNPRLKKRDAGRIASPSNVTYSNCRAVMLKHQRIARQIRLDNKGLSITPLKQSNDNEMDKIQ
jgi:hypothetical protein